MKTKLTVGGKMCIVKPNQSIKSWEHLYCFLRANNLRKAVYPSNAQRVIYVGLEGLTANLAESLSDLTYNEVFKICTILQKQEENV